MEKLNQEQINQDLQEFIERIKEPQIQNFIYDLVSSYTSKSIRLAEYFALRDSVLPKWLGIQGTIFFTNYVRLGSQLGGLEIPKDIELFLERCYYAFSDYFRMAEAYSSNPTRLYSYNFVYNSNPQAANFLLRRNDEESFYFSIDPIVFKDFLNFMLKQIPAIEQSFGVKLDIDYDINGNEKPK